ncbi:molybdopterin-dependent oxidoreductase [Actinoplanes philippinensis]|uniref:molybdopterin-dependent oxidoreductase n=1 Tax=Actinoplanes philippinensis TaxID=35752 RepID=UPI0033D6D08B
MRPGRFTSAVRSPRLTSRLGIALGVAFAVCFVTGVVSHLVQHPPGWFWWPSRPVGLYRFTQGLHVATGLATVPLLGAKLWSVYPRLFTWPPIRSLAHAAERASVAVLVAAALFQVVSGVLNVARWYAPMPFFFTSAHYWVAWLAAGALLTHIAVQLPVVRDALAPDTAGPNGNEPPRRGLPITGAAEPDHDEPAHHGRPTTGTAEPDHDEPAHHGRHAADAAEPDGGGLSRRGVLAAVGAAAGVITVTTVGQTVRPLSGLAVLAPRLPQVGPQGLPVNATATGAGVAELVRDPHYRLALTGTRQSLSLDLPALAALPQHTADLPIACVEGWSASGRWTGVRLRDLVALAGDDPDDATVLVESLQVGGRYRSATVPPSHTRDPLTLIALRLGGEPLHPDHGYPARLIAPNRPGVLQTKWVGRITVLEGR